MKTLLDEMQKRVKELEVAVLQSVAKKASAQSTFFFVVYTDDFNCIQ